MLVGSCRPTHERIVVVRIECILGHPGGCGYTATAITEDAALQALTDHRDAFHPPTWISRHWPARKSVWES